MTDQKGLRVNNGYMSDIWVKVTSISSTDQQRHTKTEYRANAKLKTPIAEVGGTFSKDEVSSQQQKEERKPSEGFSNLGQYESNIFNPATFAETKVDKVQLTIYYFGEKGVKTFLAENLSRELNDSCIVTKKGGIVKSLDRENSWIDINGVPHNNTSYGYIATSRRSKIFEILNNLKKECKDEELSGKVCQIHKDYIKLDIQTVEVILEVQSTGNEIITSLERLEEAKKSEKKEEIEDAKELLKNDMIGKMDKIKLSLDDVLLKHHLLIEKIKDFNVNVKRQDDKKGIFPDILSKFLKSIHSDIALISEMIKKLIEELKSSVDDLHSTKGLVVETKMATERVAKDEQQRLVDIERAEEKAKRLVKTCEEIRQKLQ